MTVSGFTIQNFLSKTAGIIPEEQVLLQLKLAVGLKESHCVLVYKLVAPQEGVITFAGLG
jgi:hypothetical protein